MCGNEPAISWSRCDSFRLLLNKILPALQFNILHISLSENWLEFYVNRRFYIVETHNERRKTQTTSSAKTIGLVPNQLQDACSIVFLAKNRQTTIERIQLFTFSAFWTEASSKQNLRETGFCPLE